MNYQQEPSIHLIEFWEAWLRQAQTVLSGTGVGRGAAEDWAAIVGPIPLETADALRRRCLLDEQCSKLGRVMPGDVLRLLKNEAVAEIPGADEAILEIWREVGRVGSYAAVDGHDDRVVRFSHPIVGAMASTAGWMELCLCTERQVIDGQLRRYHDNLVARWREGYAPPEPTGFRAVVADVPAPLRIEHDRPISASLTPQPPATTTALPAYIAEIALKRLEP